MSKVDIIITCYNQGILCKNTIESAINQNFQDKNIIIVDDGSNDKQTLEILNSYKDVPGISVVHEKNSGVAHARNYGFSFGTSPYVVFLDGDDLLDPNFINMTVNAIENYHAVMAYTYTKLFGTINHLWYLEKPSYKRLLTKNMIPLTCLVRREQVRKIGGFYEGFHEGIEDWDFWIRLLHEKDLVVRINRPLFLYRRQIVSRNTDLKKSSIHMEKMTSLIVEHNKEIYDKYSVGAIDIQRRNKQSFVSKIYRRIYYLIQTRKKISKFIL